MALLDEPLSALDAITRQTLRELLLLLQSRFGKTILMVTHDVEEALLLPTPSWCSLPSDENPRGFPAGRNKELERRIPLLPGNEAAHTETPPGGLPMRQAALPLLFFCIFLAVWETLCRLFALPPFLLPAPSRVVHVLAAEAPLLFRHGLTTTLEILLGILLSLAVGIPLSIAMFFSPGLEKPFHPADRLPGHPGLRRRSLLVVWFGYGMGSKVAMAAVIIFFPVTVTLLQGFKSCDPDMKTLFSVMGAGFLTTLRHLYWPWALPYFFAGLKVAVSVAAIGAVIGEWVGSTDGLGFLMMQANARLRVDLVFASIVVLSAVSLSLWGTVCIFEKNTVRWTERKR
jgi:putative hydroxymethylpyrimidine transport system permease protein